MLKNQKINLSENELISALQEKKKKGYDALYDMYSSSLFGVIQKIVQIEEIAEDVLQDTFIKVWNSFDSYDPQKGSLFTWLLNIARNMAIDCIRSKRFRNEIKNQNSENFVNEIDHHRNISFNTDTMGIQNILQNLNSDQQQLVDLIYFKGYTHTEVAEELNLPLGTVKTRLRSGILILRKQFN